jgi:hypothetical protein
MFSFATPLLCRRLLLPALFLLGVCTSHAGLVFHYAFDESSGTTAADSSGSGNTGTLNGMTGTEWTTGKVGGALSFDGTNDYVEAIGYKGISGTNAQTVAFWFQTSNSGVQMPLVAYGDFWLALLNNNVVGLILDGNNFYAGSNLTDGDWHHFAVTIPANSTSGDVVLYVDGAGTNGSGTTLINMAPANDVLIGKVTLLFNGLLDDVRMYDHALSAGEVSALAAMGSSTAPEPASVFASLGLLTAAGCGLREWRRRKKKSA